jgi:phosphoglycolate phosphatase-like HAD superfamily hydrolase
MRRLILFDIDGTLLSADRSGYMALERSVIEVLEAPRGLEGVKLDGNTDANAMRQICEREGRPLPGPEVWQRFKHRYLEILRREIVGKGHVKPGVQPLLERLNGRPETTTALVTGNIREGAEVKLRRFGLEGFFPFGAYGCEHVSRAHLVGLAMQRAAERSGTPFSPGRVTMVGDTVHDVTACHPWGIRSLAVATGSASVEELRQAGPTLAVADLSDTPAILAFLLGEAGGE